MPRHKLFGLITVPLAVALLLSPFFAGAQQRPAAERFRLEEGGTVRFVTRGPEASHPIAGRFGAVTSRITLDPANPSAARGFVEVLLSSITSQDSGWDTMFRRAPFLGIDDFPRARFEVQRITGLSRLDADRWIPARLVGRVTMREASCDKTAPAQLRYHARGSERGDHEKLDVRTTFDLTYEELQIAVPDGATREFAGDGVRVVVDLTYRGR
jgi:polyisoprenoid-binding protein YceI